MIARLPGMQTSSNHQPSYSKMPPNKWNNYGGALRNVCVIFGIHYKTAFQQVSTYLLLQAHSSTSATFFSPDASNNELKTPFCKFRSGSSAVNYASWLGCFTRTSAQSSLESNSLSKAAKLMSNQHVSIDHGAFSLVSVVVLLANNIHPAHPLS